MHLNRGGAITEDAIFCYQSVVSGNVLEGLNYGCKLLALTKEGDMEGRAVWVLGERDEFEEAVLAFGKPRSHPRHV
jgi:hypothetical protein